ncbi:MAG: type III-A CRISPR-associated RAMP protein Csm4 [Christensenellales bacterium]
MKNYIIKFNFKTPVHFGGVEQRADLYNTDFLMQNDSIFSALCIEANKMYGQDGVDKLVKMCEGDFSISSMMPYYKDNYFLPKPLLVYEGGKKVQDDEFDKNYSKNLKKLKYIKISNFNDYNCDLQNGDKIDVLQMLDDISHFGEYSTVQKVKVARNSGDDAKPFHIGVFNFEKDSGAYVVVQVSVEDELIYLTKLFNALTFDGLGGRRSNGYGKFSFEVIELEKAESEDLKALSLLLNKECERYMTLSLFMPNELDDEMLKDAYYALVRRSGFVESQNYNDNIVKKNDVYVFGVGSTFTVKLNGQLRDVGSNIGKHSVYKLLKPVFVGVR